MDCDGASSPLYKEALLQTIPKLGLGEEEEEEEDEFAPRRTGCRDHGFESLRKYSYKWLIPKVMPFRSYCGNLLPYLKPTWLYICSPIVVLSICILMCWCTDILLCKLHTSSHRALNIVCRAWIIGYLEIEKLIRHSSSKSLRGLSLIQMIDFWKVDVLVDANEITLAWVYIRGIHNRSLKIFCAILEECMRWCDFFPM